MASEPIHTSKAKSAAKPAKSREDRLKTALKANMAKRKAQARVRRDVTGADEAGKPGE